jgi:hypothetical protein
MDPKVRFFGALRAVGGDFRHEFVKGEALRENTSIV